MRSRSAQEENRSAPLLQTPARLQWFLPFAHSIVFFTIYPRRYWILPQSAWRYTAQEWLRLINFPARFFIFLIYPLQRLAELITGRNDWYLIVGYYPRECYLLIGSMALWFLVGWVIDDSVKAQKPLGRVVPYGIVGLSALCLVTAIAEMFSSGNRDYLAGVSCACWCAGLAVAAYRVSRRNKLGGGKSTYHSQSGAGK
jgi:hypothetical protein